MRTVSRVTSGEIARRRMQNQWLWGSSANRVDEVLHRFGAMQAQEFAYAKWSLAQRAPGTRLAEVDRAFAEGALLRTHLMRPTWHFVSPADIRPLLRLTAPRIHALNAFQGRQLELTRSLLNKTNRVIAKALQGGRQRTRKDLAQVLAKAGVEASGVRLAYILMTAELDEVVCSGAMAGRQHTYALFDERVGPEAVRFDREKALADLVWRYFASRGPATVKDFLRWSSLTAADGRNGLATVESRLEAMTVDGRIYWCVPGGPLQRRRGPSVDLVQGYDECIMSYSESKDVLRPTGGGHAAAEGGHSFLHVVLVDGLVTGRWKHDVKKDRVVVDVMLYRQIDRSESKALDGAIERYGDYFGMAAERGQARPIA